jgi:hypothetical protein
MFSFDRETTMGNQGGLGYYGVRRQVTHPELLDGKGNLIREPLLVMRSINVEDARQQLDAIYNGNVENPEDTEKRV